MISIVDIRSQHHQGKQRIRRYRSESFPKDLVGENYYDLLIQSIGTDIAFPVDEIKATTNPQTIEWYESKLDTHFELSVSPIYKDNTEISAYVIIQKDVTHMKKREVSAP